jgi:hypothetical protein
VSSLPSIANWSLTVSVGGRGNPSELANIPGPVEPPAEKAWCGQGEMRTEGELSLCTRTRQDRTARHPRLRPLRLVQSLQRPSQAGDHNTASHTSLPDRLIASKQLSRTAETSPSLQPARIQPRRTLDLPSYRSTCFQGTWPWYLDVDCMRYEM